jgi:nucleoid-associated protein EbfC
VEPGELNLQQLLAAAAEMGKSLMSAQQELADAEVEGTAGGGLVKATINGQGELVDLSIAKEAIDLAADAEETAQTLADLVLAACRDAYHALEDVQAEMMGPVAGGFGAGPGGEAGMPGLPGLPGLTGMPDFAGLFGGQPSSLPGTVEPDDDDEDDDEAGPEGGGAAPDGGAGQGKPAPGGH